MTSFIQKLDAPFFMALGIVHIVKGEVVGSKSVILYSLNGQLFSIHSPKYGLACFLP